MKRYMMTLSEASLGGWVRYDDHKAEVETMLGVCETYQKERDEVNAAHDAVKAELESAKACHRSTQTALDTVRRERNGLYNDLRVLTDALEEITINQVQPWIVARKALDTVFGVTDAGVARQHTESIEQAMVMESRTRKPKAGAGRTAPYPHAWQCRVVEERDQLAKRLADLRSYLKGDSTNVLTLGEYGSLNSQALFMDGYLTVLNKRIEAFRK